MGFTGSGKYVFLLVPIVLWLIVVMVSKRRGGKGSIFAILIGSDNRLSLSRGQALAWTLVIIASWCTAMAEHFRIHANHAPVVDEATKTTQRKALVDADRAFKKADPKVKEKRKSDIQQADQDIQKAKQALDAATAAAKKVPPPATAAADVKAAQTTYDGSLDAKKKLVETDDAFTAADKALKKAQEDLEYDWVQIPAALLALAGIAIGSGVFSSLIAATNSEEVSAGVSAIRTVDREMVIDAIKARDAQPDGKQPILGVVDDAVRGKESAARQALAAAQLARDGAKAKADADQQLAKTAQAAADASPGDAVLLAAALQAGEASIRSARELTEKSAAADAADAALTTFLAPKSPVGRCLVIKGTGMKKLGIVKIDRTVARIREWTEDGTTVIADLPEGSTPKKLVVETGNGKLAHEIQPPAPDLGLGQAIMEAEIGDLFRDDKNPIGFDLMKFQMFGWTVVAISVYAYLFLDDLNPNITSLPLVDSTIVILTGLSSTGYLAGKGVSNLNKPDPSEP